MADDDIEIVISDLYPDDFPEILDKLSDQLQSMQKFIHDHDKLKKLIDYKMKQKLGFDYIQRKLLIIYGSNVEKCEKLSFYLLFTKSDESAYHLKLVESCRNDQEMKEQCDYIYDLLKTNEEFNENYAIARGKCKELLEKDPNSERKLMMCTTATAAGSLFYFSRLVPAGQRELMKILPQSCTTLTSSLAQTAAKSLMVAYLGVVSIANIYKWYNGEITGKQCAANIINNVGGFCLGGAAAVGAAAVGFSFGPVGAAVGSVVGGFIGSLAGEMLFQEFTRKLFSLSKEEAVRTAYNFLGVSHYTPYHEVRKVYKEKCLQYHPDKGGKKDNFLKLQECMALINAERNIAACI